MTMIKMKDSIVLKAAREGKIIEIEQTCPFKLLQQLKSGELEELNELFASVPILRNGEEEYRTICSTNPRKK